MHPTAVNIILDFILFDHDKIALSGNNIHNDKMHHAMKYRSPSALACSREYRYIIFLQARQKMIDNDRGTAIRIHRRLSVACLSAI